MTLFLHLLSMNFKTMLAMRGAFLLRLIFTLVNHSVYLMIWVMFFRQVPAVGGWGYPHLLLAYGISLCAWGALSFFAYGVRILPRLVENGELDTILLQPRPTLFLLAMYQHEPAGLADILLGVALMVVAACWMPVHIPMLIVGVICASVTFTAFCLFISSLAFWWNDVQDWAMDFHFNAFIFATRPGTAFDGILKLMMFTAVPVAYMTLLPIEMQRLDQPALIWPLMGGTAAVAGFAWWFFNLGLKRYASGNRLTLRS